MSGYLLSIIGTVLLAAILTAVVPEGKTATVIKNVAKLSCLLVIVSPVLNIFRSLSDTGGFDEKSESFFSETVIQTDDDFIKYYCQMRIQATQSALQTELQERYAIKTEVALLWEYAGEEYDTDKLCITQILVKTEKETSEEEKKAVWEYLTKNYCSEVLIE